MVDLFHQSYWMCIAKLTLKLKLYVPLALYLLQLITKDLKLWWIKILGIENEGLYNTTVVYLKFKPSILHFKTKGPLGLKWWKGKGKGKGKECKGMSEVGNQYLTPQFTL